MIFQKQPITPQVPSGTKHSTVVERTPDRLSTPVSGEPVARQASTARDPVLNENGGTRLSEVLFGNKLHRHDIPAFQESNPYLTIHGQDGAGREAVIPFSEGLLGRHIMLIGGIGTGKTNAINHILAGMRSAMAEDSVAIIFDTKGDFHHTFYREGDVVISNDETATDDLGRANYWNIFEEIQSGQQMMESIIEISHALFHEACARTNQPFFPNAARDIFTATLWHFMTSKGRKEKTNKWLSDFLFSSTTGELKAMLNQYPQFRAMVSYIEKEDSAQTQGVLAELQQVIRQIFVGNFNKHGTLGLRSLTKKKGGRFIFIEYDLSLGSMLSPIYSLMFDIAIKESIGRDRTPGNVFFVTDEFRLLPNLTHIDDAVNFGRSLGVKFLIGIQNVEQIYENYGEERARSIMSGFLTTFAFRVTDYRSRQHIQDTFGRNRKKDSFSNIVATRGLSEETREGHVVEDWDISNLNTGEAIIGMPGREPFLFLFDYFNEDEYFCKHRPLLPRKKVITVIKN